MASLIKKYKLPAAPSNPRLRQMTEEDVPGVHQLLTSYLEKKSVTIDSSVVHVSYPITSYHTHIARRILN